MDKRYLPITFFITLFLIAFSCSSKKTRGPIIQYSTKIINAGKISLKETKEGSICLKNFGDEDLEIGEINTDCACTITKVEKRVVQPGDSTKLLFKLTPKTIGRLQQTIFVENNSENESGVLFLIRANVIFDSSLKNQ